MGTTLNTFHVFGAKTEEVSHFLAPDDVVREANTPWISAVPGNDADRLDPTRFGKIVKKLSKSLPDAYALTFYYYDDDFFSVSLFKAGKKLADARSHESWAKLGKQLDILFSDNLSSKAFRSVSACQTLDDELSLLEETLGLALFDTCIDDPRRVERCDKTLKEVKAKENALKKRPNSYKLTELPVDIWPDYVRTNKMLFETIKPDWDRYGAFRLIADMFKDWFNPPFDNELSFFTAVEVKVAEGNVTAESSLLCFNSETGKLKQTALIHGGYAHKILAVTKNGDPVCCMSANIKKADGSIVRGAQLIACIGSDGDLRWSFIPDCSSIVPLETTPEGVVTVYTPAFNTIKDNSMDSVVYRLDAETGEILFKGSIPGSESFDGMACVDSINGYAYFNRTTNEFIVLDRELNRIAVYDAPSNLRYFHTDKDHVSGSILWNSNPSFSGVSLIDLKDGSFRRINTETKALIVFVSEDGRLFGINEKGTLLTVFDPSGRVEARIKIDGFNSILAVNGDICVSAVKNGLRNDGFVSDEIVENAETDLFKVEPV